MPTDGASTDLPRTLYNRLFAPARQSALVASPTLAYSPKSGRYSLAQLEGLYGREAVILSIQTALLDLAQFVGGSPEPQTIAPTCAQVASLLVTDFGGFKPSEVSLFIGRFKRGDYGECHKFTGQAVTRAWGKFHKERNEERYAAYRREMAERSRAALNDPRVVTDPAELERITSAIIGRRPNYRK